MGGEDPHHGPSLDRALITSGSHNDGLRIREGRGKPKYGEEEIAVVCLQAPAPPLGEIETRTLKSTPDQHPQRSQSGATCAKTSAYEYFVASLALATKQRTLLAPAPGGCLGSSLPGEARSTTRWPLSSHARRSHSRPHRRGRDGAPSAPPMRTFAKTNRLGCSGSTHWSDERDTLWWADIGAIVDGSERGGKRRAGGTC